MAIRVDGDPAAGARGGRDEGVVVANPGSMRWLRPLATAVEDAGLLRAYITSVVPAERAISLASRLPPPLNRIGRQLSLRRPPPGVPGWRIVRAGTATEVLRVAGASLHVSGALADRLSLRAATGFDRATSRQLRRGDGGLVCAYTSSMESLRTARSLSIPTWLSYPTAHHRFVEQLLREEARLRPEWADSLQFHDLPAAIRSRLEAELQVADRIWVVSSFAHRSFVESGVDPARLLTIPLGVELDLFKPAVRSPGQPLFRVLFAGQITQRKGVSYLIEGFRRAALPDSELVLLGRVVGRGRAWRGQSGIRHVPHVGFFDLPAHYHAADVFVLPSLVEGFPQTALQAMACGVPTIVSTNTFGHDVVTDGLDGYVVPIRDPDAIAERLRHVYAHPEERARVAAAGRRRAEQFSWERYGSRVVQALRQGSNARGRTA